MANIVILSYYSGLTERGVETFACELAKRLIKRHQVTLFQSGSPTTQKFKIQQVKLLKANPQVATGILGRLYLDFQSIKIMLFSLLSLPKILKGKFDVVIALNGGWQVTVYRIVTKLTGMKMIVPGGAGISSHELWNLLFRPDVYVALTLAQEEWAKKIVPEVKVVQIPNGVDLSRFNPKVVPHSLSFKQPVVICACALDPVKRLDLTIKAVAKTKMLSLLILGDGELRGIIDSLGKRLLGKNYLRLFVPNDQMPSYYRLGKVFTLASRTESFGVAYVEAMACNLPVVTTHDASRAEIIGDAGILTNPVDINQYAKDLEIAAKTDYRNVPYMQALKFSWNKIAQKYAEVIDELIGSK